MRRKHKFVSLDDKLKFNGPITFNEEGFSDEYINALTGNLGVRIDIALVHILLGDYSRYLHKDPQMVFIVKLVYRLGRAFFQWHRKVRSPKTKDKIIKSFAILIAIIIAPIAMRSILVSTKRSKGLSRKMADKVDEGIEHHTAIIRRGAVHLAKSNERIGRILSFQERKKTQWT